MNCFKMKIGIVLIGVLCATGAVQGETHRAVWLKEARWGVFTHYIADMVCEKPTVESWNKAVDSFDVKALADTLESVGAGYFVISIGQNSGFYCSPNETYDRIVGISPSKCSRRDLVADLADALKPKGIRLMVYLPSGAPDLDPVAKKALEWKFGKHPHFDKTPVPPGDEDPRLAEFQTKWESVIREWSQRWGNKVSGWWFDGCYFPDAMYRHPEAPNFASFAAAARSGNPDSLVAFNPGVFGMSTMTPEDDYTTGEVADPGQFECPGERIGQAQAHMLSYIGKWWSAGPPRFTPEEVAGFTKKITDQGGAVSWDVPMSADGKIPPAFLDHLHAIGQTVKRIATSADPVGGPAQVVSQQAEALQVDANSGKVDFLADGQVLISGIQAEVLAKSGNFAVPGERYKRSVSVLKEDSSLWPSIPWTVMESTDQNRELDIRQYFKSDGQGRLLVKMTVRNVSDQPLHIQSLHPLKGLRAGMWQEGSILQYGKHRGVTKLQEGEVYHGSFLTAVNTPPFAAGFLTTNHYAGSLTVSPAIDGLDINASQGADGVLLPPGQSRESETLWISCRPNVDEEAGLWADTAAAVNRIKLPDQNFATWCSWDSGLLFQANLDGQLEKTTLANLPIVASKFLPLGMESMRVVDDSNKRGSGDWPLFTEAIPSGYAALAKRLGDQGIRPGFWYDAHRVGINSEIFKTHPDWLAKEGDGPWLIDNPNYGKYGVLDATVPAARDYLESTARKFREAGYRYCFTDFVDELALRPEQSHNPQLTRAEVARLAFEALSKGFGEDFYYLSQHSPFANLGLMQSMRVTQDSFGDKVATYRDAMAFWYLNHKLFEVDPDAWCPLRHDFLWDRCWGSWQVLGGFPITVGADLQQLTPEREYMISKLLPPLNHAGRPRDFWEREYPAVIEQTVNVVDSRWKVIGLFNFKPYAVNITLNLDRLWDDSAYAKPGFPADPARIGNISRSYLIYDFWEEKFLGIHHGEAKLHLGPDSGHQVLVLHELQNHPQVLSVGDHIGQGLEEMQDLRWDEPSKTLAGTTKGRGGVRNTSIQFHVPEGWKLDALEANGEGIPSEQITPQVIRFTVPDREKTVTWQARFGSPEIPSAGSPMRPANPGRVAGLESDPASVATFKSGLPGLFKKVLDARYDQFDAKQWELALYARPEMATAEKYTTDAGFGFTRATAIPFWDIYQHLLMPYAWTDEKFIGYRIDQLDPEKSYRIGILPFAATAEPTAAKLILRRVSDGKEFVLTDRILFKYPPHSPQEYQVLWFDVPAEAIDPAGVLLEVRKESGPRVNLSELWLLSK